MKAEGNVTSTIFVLCEGMVAGKIESKIHKSNVRISALPLNRYSTGVQVEDGFKFRDKIATA
ncbi:hypothetical protein CUMW_284490 [Citrus unshiu]|uniref:Uncharacterized protein n=1 Tax=Citrus unshiu TaxID=55188 RepID=A0A2H5N238_CITUN|nr:hypothetical protein CUMW_284490 [Citrus unshiu]